MTTVWVSRMILVQVVAAPADDPGIYPLSQPASVPAPRPKL